MVKKFKDIVKTNPEPAKGKVGVNPMDPWSAKANIAESGGSLEKYLLSRGINPKFVSKDTKISHAKSSAFQKWRQDHQFEEVGLSEDVWLDKFLSSRGINPQFATKDVKISYAKSGAFEKWKRDHMHKELQSEETDKADTISLDIPLMIRMLELAREDVKDDMELHRITERLIEIRNKGTLTMDDYEFIAGVKKLKEELEQMSEAAPKKMSPLQKFRAASDEREKKHNDIEKVRQEKLHQDPSKVSVPVANTKKDDLTAAIDRLEKHLNKEEIEQITELKKTTVKSWLKQQKPIPEKKPGEERKSYNVRIKKRSKSWDGALDRLTGRKPTSENTLDAQAATEAPCDCANNSDVAPSRNSQLSKSARMIKSLYKKLNMKEDMTDWEKEDKSVQTYGKKPKLVQPDEKTNFGENKPSARVVMSGGTTLTGEKRDTVVIDPLMKNRPGPDTFGATGKKASQQ